MHRLLRPRVLLPILIAAAVLSLGAGLGLTASAAGLTLSPALLGLVVVSLCAAAGWAWAYKEHRSALSFSRALVASREAAATAIWKDPVSGLATYRLFDAALRSAYARAQRYARPFAVLLIELSTTDGPHGSGRTPVQERVQRYLGTVISMNARSADTAARLSESMFAIVLPETDQDGALALWERLKAVAFSNWPDERPWSVSGGTAGYTVDAASVESMMADADRRLALEKRRLRAEPEP